MKKELLDKEVLCILDTRQIQQYLFRSNSFIDTLGGSDMILHILNDAILYALQNVDEPLAEDEYDICVDADNNEIGYFTSDKVKFQLIICTAGNAMCIVRTGALCQKLIRKMSRYYLENGYSLNLTTAVTEKTDDFAQDISNLYKNLNAIKASGDVLDPMGALPVVMLENRTGQPVVNFDEEEGDYVSKASQIRRLEAGKREKVVHFSQINTTRSWNNKEYKAVIHADGNNLGITIGRIIQSTPDYQEGILFRRRINKHIEESIGAVVSKSIQEVENFYLSSGGIKEEFSKEFYLIHHGGDDVNIMCNANLAIKFAEAFFQNIKSKYIWESPEITVPFYACMGIAFVTPNNDFHSSFNLAEECCKSAKTEAKKEKNLRDGLAGNWIDFQICDNPNAQELDFLREKSYVTQENINLMLRPYCLDECAENEAYSFGHLMKRVIAYKELEPDEHMQKLMRSSFALGKRYFLQCIARAEQAGIPLTQKMGKPLWTKGSGDYHAVWFDAVELSDFT